MCHSTTLADLLRDGQRRLHGAGCDSPGLDAEILLREALSATREQLFASLPEPVETPVQTRFDESIRRRSAGEPVAYITGHRAFHRYEFAVDERVLIPRPETEWLVEWSVRWLRANLVGRGTVIDVGTGSGAIGISIALETNGAHQLVASDASREALDVARRNRDDLGAAVDLVAGSVLDWCRGPVDLLAANLPYLRPDQAHSGIASEPEVALFAGQDGFDLNRQLLAQASEILSSPGGLILEIDPAQEGTARDCARRWFADSDIRTERDLAGEIRYLIVER